jgi:hypothetical protein
LQQLRIDFANIAAALDTTSEVDGTLFLRLAEVLVESFRSLNRIRLEGRAGRPKLHCILNFKYLEANLTSLLGKRTTAEAAKVVKKKTPRSERCINFYFLYIFYQSIILAQFLKYKCEQIQIRQARKPWNPLKPPWF